MMIGGLYFGTGGHFWYLFLDKKFPGTKPNIILKKLGCEAMFGPPYVSLCCLIVKLCEGKSFQTSIKELKSNFNYILAVSVIYLNLKLSLIA